VLAEARLNLARIKVFTITIIRSLSDASRSQKSRCEKQLCQAI